MIYSMTGFGKAIVELPQRKITVEIKSLNSKQLDLSMRVPQIYKALEMDIRSEIAQRLERGKVDFSIQIENKASGDSSAQINTDIIKKYYEQLESGNHRFADTRTDRLAAHPAETSRHPEKRNRRSL